MYTFTLTVVLFIFLFPMLLERMKNKFKYDFKNHRKEDMYAGIRINQEKKIVIPVLFVVFKTSGTESV